MQVNLSFTLNVNPDISEDELKKILESKCPMELVDDFNFQVSTESWDIIR